MYQFHVYARNGSDDVFVAAGEKVLLLSHDGSGVSEEGAVVSTDNGIRIKLQGCPLDGADGMCDSMVADDNIDDGPSILLHRIAKLVRRDT